MKSIVEENLVSFKTLEQKVFAYVCELGRMITQVFWKPMTMSWRKREIQRYIETKGNEKPQSKPYMGKSNTAGESIGENLRKGRWLIFTFSIRRCRWKRLG